MIKQSGGEKSQVIEISSDDTGSMMSRGVDGDSFFQPILDGESIVSQGSQKGGRKRSRATRSSQVGVASDPKKYTPSLRSLQRGVAPKDPVRRKIFLEALSDPKIMRVVQMQQIQQSNKQQHKQFEQYNMSGAIVPKKNDVKWKHLSSNVKYDFQDRIRNMQQNQIEKSATFNGSEHFSTMNSLVPLNPATEGNTTVSTLFKYQNQKDADLEQGCVISSTKPDLNDEIYYRNRMNRGEKVMYDVIPEL